MKLAFIGTGYVGLVSGTCMAEIGHEVVCADIDKKKINLLKKGKSPIYELGIEELMEKNVTEERLAFTNDVGKAIRESEVIFNAVGTPEDKKTGRADLQFVFSVAEIFGKNLNGYKLLINKSTVPVGTADKVTEIIRKNNKKNVEFEVVSNPEFLREGAAIKDFLNPDRIVVGVSSDRAREMMNDLYKPIARAGRPIVFTDVRSAEIIKYASNAFLATKISFINEIANFCEKAGGNVREVSKAMGMDTRIGGRFLHAGIGYGGSCFPKDVKALMHSGKEHGAEFQIICAADKVNQRQKLRVLDILKKQIGDVKGKNIAIWGLGFKPRTDDIREAPAIDIIKELIKGKANILAFDPVASANMKKEVSGENVKYVKNAYAATKEAHVLLILTEWDEFRVPDFSRLKKNMKRRLIIDGRNILDRKDVEEEGFAYIGIGS